MWENLRPFADIEESYALWPIEFVGRSGEQVNAQFIHIHRNVTHSLDGIRVKKRMMSMS